MLTLSLALLSLARFVFLSCNMVLIAITLVVFDDPTDQTIIDNFRVQQLDRTQNEWGWSKQKEFMILPIGASSFKKATKMGVEVYHNLKENKEGLELLKTAIDKAGYTGKNNNGSQKISGDQLKDLYKSFISGYRIVSIEDPFDQDDWEH
ncbi:Enolase [Olea europaea subsp. europaea]|uniref:phosphopyruvate hydratase n=1 Tax=Olea europaea subsp. europaea TaxID=158383 RepID=A0A8S0Q5H7_OLEEU|nr:Enolase [Olea europaea subsp. europaea]